MQRSAQRAPTCCTWLSALLVIETRKIHMMLYGACAYWSTVCVLYATAQVPTFTVRCNPLSRHVSASAPKKYVLCFPLLPLFGNVGYTIYCTRPRFFQKYTVPVRTYIPQSSITVPAFRPKFSRVHYNYSSYYSTERHPRSRRSSGRCLFRWLFLFFNLFFFSMYLSSI